MHEIYLEEDETKELYNETVASYNGERKDDRDPGKREFIKVSHHHQVTNGRLYCKTETATIGTDKKLTIFSSFTNTSHYYCN